MPLGAKIVSEFVTLVPILEVSDLVSGVIESSGLSVTSDVEVLGVVSEIEVMFEGLEVVPSGAGTGLEGLGETAGLGFGEERGVDLRPSENKRILCFLVGAWRDWLKSVVCPSLLSVLLRMLCVENSEPRRGRVGIF